MTLNLLPNERIVRSSKANAVVRPSDYGMSEFAAGHLMGLVGMAGREAIGGRLHVTSLRLLFQAHAVNRLRGQLAIPLPSIRSASRYRSGLAFGVEVVTAGARLQFVNWSAGKVLASLEDARAAFGEAEAAEIAAAGTVVRDLELWRAAEAANVLVAAGIGLPGAAPGWLEYLSLIELRTAAAPPTRPHPQDDARS
ncbi:hypothetical protein [Oerskovia flava]|uniref:hypothetical protein n=1 Tax=Oerskovia flava TaxID=2986422 RepID=UPI00223FAC15|nr:hypothetical protein [Oerskovia sp. JB1-3-2]